MKGLYRRGNIWWYRFTPAPGAAQAFVSTGETDEREAITKALEFRAQAASEVRAQLEACETEVAIYLAWLRRDGLADSTISSRGYILRSFVAEMGAATPLQIAPAAVARWFDGRWQKKPHTAVAYLNVVSWWLSWLVDRGKLRANPAEGIEVPQNLPMQRRRQFLRPADARRVIDECDDEGLKFCLYCALQAGMRKLEIIEAQPRWFDIDAGLIHITETPTFEPKDREKRTVPMTAEFHAWLRDGYGLRSPFMLEPEVKHGKYRYRFDFRKAFDAHMERCGLADVTFHDLRRTFASLLASDGVSIYKIAKWLGDTVEQTENTYGHLLPQDADINPSWATGKTGSRKGKLKGPNPAARKTRSRADFHRRKV